MFYIPDISFYQYRYKADGSVETGINFTTMSTMTKGAIIRAGQGTWEDKMFKTSWSGAKAAGLRRGSYWFYDPRVEPKRQAEKWAEVLGGDYGEMEHFADFERLVISNKEVHGYDMPQHWYDFMEYSKQLMPGIKLGVYTGFYYWCERHLDCQADDYWLQYPLWIAYYGGPAPQLPKPWKNYLFWQFTDNGPGPEWGVASGNIDLNHFNGTEAQFSNRYNFTYEEKPMNNRYAMTAKTNGVRARSTHDASTSNNILSVSPHHPIGTLFEGDAMYSPSTAESWMHVTHINGTPVNMSEVWVARRYGNVDICVNFVDRGEQGNPQPDPEESNTVITVTMKDNRASSVNVNGVEWRA